MVIKERFSSQKYKTYKEQTSQNDTQKKLGSLFLCFFQIFSGFLPNFSDFFPNFPGTGLSMFSKNIK